MTAVLTRFLAFAAAFMVALPVLAQKDHSGPVGPFPAWVGERGITETVGQIMERERRTPPRPFQVGAENEAPPDRSRLTQDPASPWIPQWPWSTQVPNAPTVGAPTWDLLGLADNPQTLGLNQNALTFSEAGFIPPDSMGAVGPTQVLVCVNGRIKVFDKVSGAVGGLNASTNTFFNSVRNASNAVDPQVRFDRLSNRWFVLMINVTTPNRILLAVSSGPTITAASSFTFFFFQQDLVTPTGNAAQLADYPSLGVDASALYTGANMFTSSFQGCSLWVIQKASVLGAGPIVVTAFRNVTGATGAGMYSPRGVDNPDPSATQGYFIGVNNGALGSLVLRRVSTPGGAPTLSSNITLTVPATATPIAPPAPGSSPAPESLGDRLFAAQIWRNRATGVDSLWTAHNIQVNSAGVASSTGGRDGSRWYQIGNLGTTPTLTQSGTLFDPGATNPISYWICTVAATGQGHMALGSSFCGATTQIGCSAAGRLSTDALGTTQGATTLAPGAGNYQVLGLGRQRWGDYSFVAVDPTDDQTMWTIQEFCDATNSYAVRMTKLRAPPPAMPSICLPGSVAQGASNVNVTLTGISAAGSAFYDTDPSWANRLAASVGGSGVTVNSVSFSHATPTQLTMIVSVSAAAALGARAVTVINPDGQSATSATGILTVTGGAVCPSFTLNPVSQSVNSGQGVTFTVAATGTPAPTFQWRKNGSNISVATGTSYSIASTVAADAGAYDCIATNTCGSVTSSAAQLTVTCYANCDGSTGSPPLTANDFQCFINAYANALAYANCDGSTGSPLLTGNDFQCFLNAYANGCP